jgi:hypothetical protein|tara:strand:- start:1000 stop:1176 length:177 start_codon:yes stop_codon:yes gene_type:complete
MKSKIEIHSEEMSLLGQKLGLIKTQALINKEIEKVNKKLDKIGSRRVLDVLRGKEEKW